MRELNNKIYFLLTLNMLDLLTFFAPGLSILALYTFWVIFRGNLSMIIVSLVIWLVFFIFIYYVTSNHITTKDKEKTAGKKKKKKEEVKDVKSEKDADVFVMEVDEEAVKSFTFNDYVIDTFKKQDSTQILDLLADRNNIIMEELKK